MSSIRAAATLSRRSRLSKAAMTLLRQFVEGPEPKLIRVAVKNKGCAGLSYVLEYAKEKGRFDEVITQD
ncbi:17429_t:CDS:2, partial [Racocetra fulgida]